MNRFYFGGSDTSGSDDDAPLPYPQPLPRIAFLTPNFSPTEFLASLSNRHQTLEDLRQELWTRSQELNKELLDLVNDNYQDFLELGGSLRGGEDKIEEVKVALLGFRGDIWVLKEKVSARRKEVERLLEERRAAARDIRFSTALLEVDARLGELEKSLMVGGGINSMNEEGTHSVDFSESDEGSEGSETGSTISISQLGRRVERYIMIKRLIARMGLEHPFLVKQKERLSRIRQTLLLDLGTALQQEVAFRGGEGARKLKILGVFRDMGESAEAVTLLRGYSHI